MSTKRQSEEADSVSIMYRTILLKKLGEGKEDYGSVNVCSSEMSVKSPCNV